MIDRLVDAPLWLQVLLLVGVVARAITLVVYDRITKAPRVWLQRRLPPYVAYLLGCPWCIGIWLTAAAVVAWVLWPRPTLVVALGGAVAFTASALVEKIVGPPPKPPAPLPHDG